MKETIIKLCREDEKYIDILKKLVEYEENYEDKEVAKSYDKEADAVWEWHDVGIPSVTLNKLVFNGIAKIVYKSRSATVYRLVNREEVKKALEILEFKEQEASKVEEKIPDDLFYSIVGFEDIKTLLNKIIKNDVRVHILFVGPPASGKTLFLLELIRLPNSYYVLGSSTSKAGLSDSLFVNQPKYLMVDEIDKMSREDMSTLLSLMETGILTETKYGKTRTAVLNTVVFACCNSDERIPRELLSRFLIFRFSEYSKEEFKEIVIYVLTQREGIEKEIAEYIAEIVWEKLESRDPRDAVKIARLAKTKEEVDIVIKTLLKYQG